MKPISTKELAKEVEGQDVMFPSGVWHGNIIHISTQIVRLLTEGKAVNLPGVGTLYPATRAARRKKCGLTGEVLDWPEVRKVKFRASKVVERELNKEGK